MAFFRMKLYSVDVFIAYRSGELITIITGHEDIIFAVANGVVRMHKIISLLCSIYSLQQWAFLLEINNIPSHVRNFKSASWGKIESDIVKRN